MKSTFFSNFKAASGVALGYLETQLHKNTTVSDIDHYSSRLEFLYG